MPNTPHQVIEEMFAYIAKDPADGSEGVTGFRGPDGWMPMVGADIERALSLRDMAKAIARQSGQTVRLVRFSVREVLEVIEP
jgi:hypothetical protein